MKYTIKAFIKDKNETVSSVANKLQLSRPTFDTYIMIYEEGLPLPKAKYQRIFDSLFSDYYISSNAFKERLDMCETILTSGMQYDSIEFLSRRADRASTLIERIRQNINYENLDEDLYEFINLLITNYSDAVFYNLVQYFLMLYGKKDMDQVTELQMAYFAEFFLAFENFNKSNIQYNLSDWERYQQRCERAQINNKLRNLELEKERLKSKEEDLRRQLYGNTIW